jgi:hypothetical protein
VEIVMDIFLKTIAIFIEALILLVIFYAVAKGTKLTLFELGLKSKYNAVINLAIISLGVIFLVFLIAHLVTFYPPV